MNEQPLLVEIEGGIAVLTINRPQNRNAVNRALATAFAEAFDALADDASVRVIIITGAGDQAFCAGADLKERATMAEGEVKSFLRGLHAMIGRLEELPKPVIAAINGFALGGGLEFALACDIRLASENAELGLTEVRLAIIPGGGGTQRLPRLIGVARAKEMIFTGKRVSANEAAQLGLVNHVVPRGELLTAAKAMAAEMCKGGPIALAQAKFAIHQGMQTDLHTGLNIERKAYEVVIPTEDRMEALSAFIQKREPVFKGR